MKILLCGLLIVVGAGCSHFDTLVSKPRELADGSLVQTVASERVKWDGQDGLILTQYRQEPGEAFMHREGGVESADHGALKSIGPAGELAVGDAAAAALLRPVRINESNRVQQTGASAGTVSSNATGGAGGTATGGAGGAGGTGNGGAGGQGFGGTANSNSNAGAGSNSNSGANSGSSSNSGATSNSGANSGSSSNSGSNSGSSSNSGAQSGSQSAINGTNGQTVGN